jgi:DNA-binding MarR family transcriptional regulator
MEDIRFIQFTQMLDSMQKLIKRIELDYAPTFGVKGVHLFWLYALLGHPDGLTAAELAVKQGIDRSLVSREIAHLMRDGLIETKGGVRGYNARLTLTDKGKEAANRICDLAYAIQCKASEGVSLYELELFYTVFEKLRDNLYGITELAKNQTDTRLLTEKEGQAYENAEA